MAPAGSGPAPALRVCQLSRNVYHQVQESSRIRAAEALATAGGHGRTNPIAILETKHMNLKHLIVGTTTAIALTLAGAVMAESAKEKAAIAGAVKADQAQSAANAEQNEANKFQKQADQAEKDAAAARAKAAAHPTAATEHEAKVKTKEAVDAAGLAGDMEKKAAAKAKAAESVK